MKLILFSLYLINFVFYQNPNTSKESLGTTLTISERAPLLLQLNLESEKIGYLEKGTNVVALYQTGLTYQVVAPNGNTGWVEYQYFEESKKLRIEPFNDKPVPFYRELNERRWVGRDKIRDFEPGETVNFLEGLELKGFVKVRDQFGDVGWVSWHRARPALESIIPEYEQLDYWVIPESLVESMLIGQPIDNVITMVGNPDAMIIDTDGNGFVFFRKLYLVSDGKRVGHIRFDILENKVQTYNAEKEAKNYWIEELPLASWIRTFDFGLEFQKMQGYELFPSTGEMKFAQKWGWRTLWFITLILFFSIPHFIASLMTTLTGFIKSLPNSAVRIFGVLSSLTLMYVYLLFIGLHMLHDQHILLILAFLIVGYFSLRVINSRISYKRCPECHSFFKSENLGSEIVAKKHRTEHKHRDVYKGTRETSTQIIKEYERQNYTEKSTELDIDDYQQCTVCGHNWIVERFKLVRGHV